MKRKQIRQRLEDFDPELTGHTVTIYHIANQNCHVFEELRKGLLSIESGMDANNGVRNPLQYRGCLGDLKAGSQAQHQFMLSVTKAKTKANFVNAMVTQNLTVWYS